MRTETEMMHLIRTTAEEDDGIRAALLCGSRANPDISPDGLQDYDVVYIVRDLSPFGETWLDRFGERLLLQCPERMRDPMGDGRETYLCLLRDGNRIDLQLIPLERLEQIYRPESNTRLLLDKDHLFPHLPPPSGRDFESNLPTQLDYHSCCNNFWWCLQNVAKGILRSQLPYAMGMLHNVVRQELHQMLTWKIVAAAGSPVNVGKMGAYFAQYLTPGEWECYRATYTGPDPDAVWSGIGAMMDLFGGSARQVASSTGFPYREDEEQGTRTYLQMLKQQRQQG